MEDELMDLRMRNVNRIVDAQYAALDTVNLIHNMDDYEDYDDYNRYIQGSLSMNVNWMYGRYTYDDDDDPVVLFHEEHPFQGCEFVVFANQEHHSLDLDSEIYPIRGTRWIDIYIACNACVILSEGNINTRYISDFERVDNRLMITVRGY